MPSSKDFLGLLLGVKQDFIGRGVLATLLIWRPTLNLKAAFKMMGLASLLGPGRATPSMTVQIGFSLCN